MNATISPLAPHPTLRDAAALGAVQRLAWTMGRPRTSEGPADGPRPDVASALAAHAVRRARAGEALLRLAGDPAATVAERALAAERAARLLGRTA